MADPTNPTKGQQTMQNERNTMTIQLHLDTEHFHAQVAEMAKFARQEFFRQVMGAVRLTCADVQEAESTPPKLSAREVVQMAKEWAERAEYSEAVGGGPPSAQDLISALSTLAAAE